ncbi:hypothetical protein [Anaerorhabdus sp.]|jgi:hypothetical protein|uniref:hypothetical protein n=1 Tax=Anaerorhabdus sp. TaxID=1872524 RepID=UPI002FC8DBE1
MKKFIFTLCLLVSFIGLTGFKAEEFSIENLDQYNKEFKTEEIEVCSTSSTKTYMPYTAITATGSKQYKYIQEHMTVDQTTGMLYDEDGFIGAALGYSFGEIGTRYYFTLDSGIILPIVKIDAKASQDAPNGCSHSADASVIEFVIDSSVATEYFGAGPTGLVNQGNFNNDSRLKGNIEKIEKVLSEKIEEGVYYETTVDTQEIEKNIIGQADTELALEGGIK